MQLLSRRPDDGIVRLRSDQLVSEFEPAVHLAENPLLFQPRQSLPGPGRGELHDFVQGQLRQPPSEQDRKSTRLNSSHSQISYAVFCLKKKKKQSEYSYADADSHQTNLIVRIL